MNEADAESQADRDLEAMSEEELDTSIPDTNIEEEQLKEKDYE